MPFSYDNTLAFIHIPKCAGTSISKMIGASTVQQLYCAKRNNKSTQQHDSFKKTPLLTEDQLAKGLSKSPQHLTAFEILNMVNDIPPTMFTVVRNPFERIVSEYVFVNSEIKGIRLAEARKGFNSFVQWGLTLPETERIKKFDGHLETQTSFIHDPTTNKSIIPPNNIFRFENIKQCFDFISASLKMAIPQFTDKIHPHPHYSTYYNAATIELVNHFYQDDLMQFNYSFQTE